MDYGKVMMAIEHESSKMKLVSPKSRLQNYQNVWKTKSHK